MIQVSGSFKLQNLKMSVMVVMDLQMAVLAFQLLILGECLALLMENLVICFSMKKLRKSLLES